MSSQAVTGGAAAASMVSAYITLLDPPGPTVTFPYSLDPYTKVKKSEWHSTPQPANPGGGTPQFQGVHADTMNVKVVLDAFGVPPIPVQASIEILEMAMAPSTTSTATGDAKPPTVIHGWGTNIIMEEAYITSLSITHKRFLMGVSVLAEVIVSLEAVPSVVPGTNPTSGGLATRRTHTVVAGDTLASVAYEEYRNPTKWRALAEANGIDDPMRLRPGAVLIVPNRGEADSLI